MNRNISQIVADDVCLHQIFSKMEFNYTIKNLLKDSKKKVSTQKTLKSRRRRDKN